jgi:uncharacterized membrane protein YfcA
VTIDVGEFALLLLAGAGAGLVGATAGLASLVSYPALLAAGIPPVVANMTNTVAMLGTTAGAAAGARPELAGQWRRLLPLCVITTTGGVCGGLVLLLTPSGAFTAVVPWLIGGASLLLVAGPWLRRMAHHPARQAERPRIGPLAGGAAFLVGGYAGYFGAAAGVLMLALLTTVWAQPLARTNAAKNIATGTANLVAAVVFSFTGRVLWPAAIAVCLGSVAGSWLGSILVRYLPATPLRIAIALAGLVLAVVLARQAYGG